MLIQLPKLREYITEREWDLGTQIIWEGQAMVANEL